MRGRWLYRLILAMDANFRLKNRLRSSTRGDPSLNSGWAYFVDDKEYRAHIIQYATQEEVRTSPKHPYGRLLTNLSKSRSAHAPVLRPSPERTIEIRKASVRLESAL